MGKRKVSVKSDADDEVTAKLLKTTSTDVDKKLGLADEDSDHGEVNKEEELQKEAPLLVSKKPFVAKKFRDALRKSDYITELRIFLQKAESDATIVSQFLQCGGKPLEIAQVLNKVDKNELFHISYVFSALHLVLIEKMNQESHLNRDAVEVCSYVLNNHRVSIEKMLSSNYATHKKSVLKLLTDAVYLAPHLGRELLTTFNVAFNSETLKRFTAHERNETNLPDDERVRSCYIYFILSFIIEGNHVLIKNLLDRNELLMALLSGLIYDSKETVLLVLNSFLKFILQSGAVSKTKKVQVFNANIVNELIRLLEWKGPGYFAAISHKKTKDKAAQFINIDDRNTVCNTVYLFLCELLASRKNGIAFKCLGQRQLKFNCIQKDVLVKIEHFMGNSQKVNLIIEILKACPELMKKFVQKHASCLDAFKKNNNWFEAVDFFAKLIDSLTPDIIQYQHDKMNTKETIELIKDICMAPELLQQLRNKNTLRSENLNIRQKSTNLLYLMFKQCNQYLFKISQWNVHRANDLKKIKFDLINHILTLCPTVENILLSLHMTQVDETANSEKMFEHLECILDLLLIITQSIPSFIDTTSSVINYIQILGPIYELNRELESSTRIEFKAVKLMLALEPKALSPKTKFFSQIVQSFFNVYRFGGANERNEAKHLLRTVFLNTGLFENGPLEIDLWLVAIDHIDEDSLTPVREFLVKQINSYDANNSQITQIHSKLPSSMDKNLAETFAKIEKGTTLKGLLDVATLRPFFLHVVQSIQQIPDKKVGDDDDDDDENGEKAEILEYIETVAFYLFHYLPLPESVYYVIEPIAQKYSSYMKKWIVQSKCGKFPTEFPSTVLSKFYESLMENSHDTIVGLFDEHLTAVMETIEPSDKSNDLLVNVNGIDYKLSQTLMNETQVMVLIYTLMFVTNQRHKNNTLTHEQCTQAITYFGELMSVLDAIAITSRETNEHGFELNESAINPSVKALKYVYSVYLLQSFDIWSKDNQITRFVYETVKNLPYTESLNNILVHYRKKISNQIVVSVEKRENLPETHENLIDLLNTFHLDADNCCEILTILSQLKYSHYVTPQNEISTYAGILSYALRRLAEIKERGANSSIIDSISALYVCLISSVNVEINYQVIEEALVAYLTVYYHHLLDVRDDFFAAIFGTKRLNKAAIKLACLLLERKPTAIEHLPKLIEDNMPKKELIYPLLNVVATKHIDLSDKLLAKLYGEYKNGIMKTIEKPAKAAVIYKENVLSSVFLIEKCMPINECTDFVKKIINFEGADVFQLQIIKSIHLKVLMHSDKVDAIQQSYENFLAIFVRLFGTLLKHDPLDMKRVNCFIYIAYDWTKLKLKLLPAALTTQLEYEQICGTQLWIQLGKSCLKHGLRLQKDDASKIKEDAAGLLKIFAYLCNEFYANDGKSDDVRLFFEMVVSHPSFFNIITSEIITMQQKTQLKTNLAYLLYVLLRKNAEVMDSNHIPILLAGYQGKMSFSDQYILAILQMYEKNECNMRKYRPYIFGESALIYYSLNSNVKPSLLQEPQDQVMALFDADISENTLVNFPVWRKLNVIDQVPAVEFTFYGIVGQEHSNNVSIAKSTVEKLVECGDTSNVDPTVLTESARRDETFENVYDPAFLIPLMQMAFAPEACTKPLRPVQNGMLAITFACLSSSDKDMRLAGATAFQRYRNHMESARFVDNKLWIHIFNAICNGVQNLTLEAQKRKKHRIPRIPYIAGVFFARTINTLMNPLSELYRPLSTFLLIKNSFEFMTVPEFNVLFHSPDVNHNIHRSFILDVLRDGLKTSNDFNVLISNHIFKALLGFYATPTTTRERNIQILTVVNAAAKIPKSAKHLIDMVGILPWLSNVADNVEFFQFDFLDILCTILNNLYNSVAVNRDEYGATTVNSIEIQMLLILLKIGPNLSQRIAEVSFVRYVNLLKSIAVKSNRCKFLNEDNIQHLLKCMSGYVSADLAWDCNFLMENAHAHQTTERKFEYNRRLREQDNGGNLNESTIFIVSALREIIICWQNAKHS